MNTISNNNIYKKKSQRTPLHNTPRKPMTKISLFSYKNGIFLENYKTKFDQIHTKTHKFQNFFEGTYAPEILSIDRAT